MALYPGPTVNAEPLLDELVGVGRACVLGPGRAVHAVRRRRGRRDCHDAEAGVHCDLH